MKWERVTPFTQQRNAKSARLPAAVHDERLKSLIGSWSLSASKSASRPMSAASRASNLPTRAAPPRSSEKDSEATRSFRRSITLPLEVITKFHPLVRPYRAGNLSRARRERGRCFREKHHYCLPAGNV